MGDTPTVGKSKNRNDNNSDIMRIKRVKVNFVLTYYPYHETETRLKRVREVMGTLPLDRDMMFG